MDSVLQKPNFTSLSLLSLAVCFSAGLIYCSVKTAPLSGFICFLSFYLLAINIVIFWEMLFSILIRLNKNCLTLAFIFIVGTLIAPPISFALVYIGMPFFRVLVLRRENKGKLSNRWYELALWFGHFSMVTLYVLIALDSFLRT